MLKNMSNNDNNNIKSSTIAHIKWHNKPITSISFNRKEDSLLAIASEDNIVS